MATFAQLGLSADLLKALDQLGFSAPTEVQEELIPAIIGLRHDVVGLAQTGTGKTAAFGLPLIDHLDQANSGTQVLILCPTRELCVQVTRDLHSYARYLSAVKIVAVYGGAGIVEQSRQLRQGGQIIVATPGRLLAFIKQGEIDISSIRAVVLDEADEMLQMGFQDDLNEILAATPEDKKTLLFSATMPREVTAIARKYMHDPVEITVGERNQGVANVKHIYYLTAAKHRYQALRRVVDNISEIYAIIFCRTRQEVREVAEKLLADGYQADALHGELSQVQRDLVMQRFRRRHLQLLVATDVAARGLDIKNLTHVINYNLPDDIAVYTHRSGRTGRAGKQGVSIAFIHLREKYRLREIEKRLQRSFEAGRIPTGPEICRQLILRFLAQLPQAAEQKTALQPFLPEIMGKLADLSREELAERFILAEFGERLQTYLNEPDLNERGERSLKPESGAFRQTPERAGARRPGEKSGTREPRVERENWTLIHFNVGSRDGVNPGRLIGVINDASAGSTRIRVGRIEIKPAFSLLETDRRFAGRVIKIFSELMINGRPVVARAAEKNETFSRRSPPPESGADKRRSPDRGPGTKPGPGKRPAHPAGKTQKAPRKPRTT